MSPANPYVDAIAINLSSKINLKLGRPKSADPKVYMRIGGIGGNVTIHNGWLEHGRGVWHCTSLSGLSTVKADRRATIYDSNNRAVNRINKELFEF